MRLTDHLEKDSVFTCDEKTFIKCYKKLSLLEDIEDELGIDLVTLGKALVNGFNGRNYANTNGDINKVSSFIYNSQLKSLDEYSIADREWFHFYLKDYGKTWALTKEEFK